MQFTFPCNTVRIALNVKSQKWEFAICPFYEHDPDAEKHFGDRIHTLSDVAVDDWISIHSPSQNPTDLITVIAWQNDTIHRIFSGSLVSLSSGESLES